MDLVYFLWITSRVRTVITKRSTNENTVIAPYNANSIDEKRVNLDFTERHSSVTELFACFEIINTTHIT